MWQTDRSELRSIAAFWILFGLLLQDLGFLENPQAMVNRPTVNYDRCCVKVFLIIAYMTSPARKQPRFVLPANAGLD